MKHSTQQRYARAAARLGSCGQEHVLRYWNDLSEDQRDRLLSDIESIDLGVVTKLTESHVRHAPGLEGSQALSPAKVWPNDPGADSRAQYDQARARGAAMLEAGTVAAMTVAGGQGTRLGFDGPKGAYPVTPVRKASLFQLFAETIQAASKKYGTPIPWYIMTGDANHTATQRFFEQHDFFGLQPADVLMFVQGQMPAFAPDGKMLLAGRDRLALSPDGHGGSLKALVASGSLADMQRRGIRTISYFQVDNPLVRPFDPLFLGLHADTGSQMSTKVARKADDHERVGNVCLRDGRLAVVEYSEFADDLARARSADGSRTFDAGNLAIHLIEVEFVRRVIDVAFQLPYRRAEKMVPYVGDDGKLITPRKPNAVKLEMFVFDALELAENPLVLEVDRAEEFSPVKNAQGTDSLESSIRDQVARAYAWLERCGLHPPRHADGTPAATVELAPSFAIDAEDLSCKRGSRPQIKPGCHVVLS